MNLPNYTHGPPTGGNFEDRTKSNRENARQICTTVPETHNRALRDALSPATKRRRPLRLVVQKKAVATRFAWETPRRPGTLQDSTCHQKITLHAANTTLSPGGRAFMQGCSG